MSTIPTEIKHSDLLKALRPLMDLLGVDEHDLYAEPGLTIKATEVTFLMFAGDKPEGGRRMRVPASDVGLAGPRGDVHDEVSFFVRVKTDLAEDSSVNVAARNAVQAER